MDMNPGPIDGSVLYDQDKHVSAAVWEGQERGALRCHEHTSKLGEWKLTPRQIALVEKAGFGYLRKIPAISLDNPLISALVERWRRETNTFHFTVGEMTVTLQDVALLLGLAIDGKPVIGLTHTTCGLVCERLLGRAPDSNYASGGMVKLSWLKEFFSHCPEDAPTEEVERCTRAYLLYLVGSTIFSTTTGNKVPVMYLPLFEDFEECGKYAWGAAALAFLYRALGNACVKSQSTICGCLTLLQCWSYFHLNIGRPKLNRDPIHDHFPFVLRWKGKQSGPTTNRDVVFYRKALDLLKPSDVDWRPYKYMDSTFIPEDINSTLILGKSKTMLICFDKAERHLPDRCLRQYGMFQPIPEDVVRWVRKSRGVDGGVDLSGKMEAELNEWMDRRVQIVQGDDGIDDETEYMQWYSKITRKVVGRPISLSSEFQRTISGLREIAYLADSFSTKGLDGQQFDSISRIRFIAQDCLRDQGGSPAITSPTLQIEHGKRTRGKERVRRKGTGKRRRKDDSLDYQEASEDEADEQPQFYGAVIGADQLHIHQAEGEVGQLQLRLVEDEVDPQHLSMTGGVDDGTELLVVNRVDDMQLIEETGAVNYSQSNHATEEVKDSEMLEATTKEVEDSQNCAPHNEVTDSQTYLARMNEDHDSQPCEVEDNSNDLQPCDTKITEVNNSHLQVASNEINDSQLPDASRMDCDSEPPGSKKEDNGLSLPDTTERQNDCLLPAAIEENDSNVINELPIPDETKETGNSQLPDTTKEAEHLDETKETGTSQLSDTTKEAEHFDETKETGNSQLPDTTKEAEHSDTSKANPESDSTEEANGSQLPEETTETGQSEQPTVEATKDDVPEVEAKPDDRKVAV